MKPALEHTGERLAMQVRAEIARWGLGEYLTAGYIHRDGLIRVGLKGDIMGGIGYEPEPESLRLITEHLERLASLTQKGPEGTMR